MSKTSLVPVRADLTNPSNKVKSDWRTVEPAAKDLLKFLDAARVEIISTESQMNKLRQDITELKNSLYESQKKCTCLQHELSRIQRLSNEHVSIQQKLDAAKASVHTVVVTKHRVGKS